MVHSRCAVVTPGQNEAGGGGDGGEEGEAGRSGWTSAAPGETG